MKRYLLLVALLACNPARGPQVTEQPATGSNKPRDAGVEVDAAPSVFVGVLTAAESVDITPRASGVLASVAVGPGDEVVANQVIAEMDPAQAKKELGAAEAAIRAASAAVTTALVEVEDAKRKLALETQAFKDGVSSKSAVDAAAVDVKRAEAIVQQRRSAQAVEAARAQAARDQVTDTALRAPFAGTVAARYRDAGNRIDAGSPIVKIVGRGSMRLRFAVPPQLARIVQVGTKITATIDTIPDAVSATVKQVTPTLDAASGMIIVEAELSALQTGLRPGLAAWVRP